jgi:hypothetical protein
MALLTLTVVVIVLLVATLAFYLFVIGGLLNDVANNLDDCRQSVRKVCQQVEPVSPGIARLNKSGSDLLDAVKLLIDGADRLAAKLAPAAPAPAASAAVSAPSSPPPPASSETRKASVGYLDSAVSVGYLDE